MLFYFTVTIQAALQRTRQRLIALTCFLSQVHRTGSGTFYERASIPFRTLPAALLIAQRLNRVEPSGAQGWIEAKNQATT